jgi:1-deoxy-D-xylulose-5-phosphate synthase
VGEDGPTHHGAYDMSFLRNIPRLIMAAPADENELQHLLKTAFDANAPFVLRYPRGAGFGVTMDPEPKTLPVGKGRLLKAGKDVTILAIGNRVHPALEAAQELEKQGISAAVADMRFVKPLDTELIDNALKTCPRLVSVEDGVLAGGFGAAVAEYLTDKQADFKLLRLGIGDEFVEHGKVAQLYDKVGISTAEIVSHIKQWLKK